MSNNATTLLREINQIKVGYICLAYKVLRLHDLILFQSVNACAKPSRHTALQRPKTVSLGYRLALMNYSLIHGVTCSMPGNAVRSQTTLVWCQASLIYSKLDWDVSINSMINQSLIKPMTHNVRWEIGLSLLEIKAWCLINARLIPEQIPICCQRDHTKEQSSWNIYEDIQTGFPLHAFEINVFRESLAILFEPRCVKKRAPGHLL